MVPKIVYTTDEQIEEMRNELKAAKNKSGGKKSRNRKDGKKSIGKRAGFALFLIVIVFLSGTLVSILMSEKNGESPSFFGYQLYVVESGSMKPTLNVGTVILSRKPQDSAALKVGDIVTFKTLSGKTVTHRITGVLTQKDGSRAYRTKGDNPINSPDADLLTPDRVMAVFVLKVPMT